MPEAIYRFKRKLSIPPFNGHRSGPHRWTRGRCERWARRRPTFGSGGDRTPRKPPSHEGIALARVVEGRLELRPVSLGAMLSRIQSRMPIVLLLSAIGSRLGYPGLNFRLLIANASGRFGLGDHDEQRCYERPHSS